MKKLKATWQSLWVDVDRRVRIGRILGLAFITVGFVLIGKAWDGSAGVNFVQGQVPYLLSGGFMGMAMVITGCTLLFLSTVRAERQILTDKFDEMTKLLSRNLGRLQISSNGSGGSQEQVVAGSEMYHRADCRILVGKKGTTLLSVAQATGEGLTPCRACQPPQPAESKEQNTTTSEPVSVGNGKPGR
jgi:hypothetical protein